jgi:hypothetical protein
MGQALRVERDVCHPDPHDPEHVQCAPERIGSGEVVELETRRCARVRLIASTPLSRGDRLSVSGVPARRPATLAVRP